MITKLRAHPVWAMLAYLALYLLGFGLLERWNRPFHPVYCRLDGLIPFVPAAVVPYLLWFGWIPLTLLWFLRRAPDAFWRLFGAIACGCTAALGIFAVYPTVQLLRPPLPSNGPFTALVQLIYQVDTPTNVCPSLHTFVSVILLLAVLTAGVPMHRSLKLAHALLCVSVCCSTVLLRQHSCVDVFWGVVLAAVIWPLTGRWLQDVYGPRPQRRPLLRS